MASTGGAGLGAFASCRELHDAFNRALSTSEGAARYMVSKHGEYAIAKLYSSRGLLQHLLRDIPPPWIRQVLAVLSTIKYIRGMAPGADFNLETAASLSRGAALAGHVAFVGILSQLTREQRSPVLTQALVQAIPFANSAEVLRLLYGTLLEVFVPDRSRVQDVLNQVLRHASLKGLPAVAIQALHIGAQANFQDSIALVGASLWGEVELAAELLRAGANPNAGQGLALRLTALHDRAEVAQLLLAAGADPAARDGRHFTYAASHGAWNVMRALLAYGLPRAERSGEMLYFAVRNDAVAEAYLLLNSGVTITCGPLLSTATRLAARHGRTGLLRALLNMHPPVSVPRELFFLGFHAAERGRHRVVEALYGMAAERGGPLGFVTLTCGAALASAMYNKPDVMRAVVRQVDWPSLAACVAYGALVSSLFRHAVPTLHRGRWRDVLILLRGAGWWLLPRMLSVRAAAQDGIKAVSAGRGEGAAVASLSAEAAFELLAAVCSDWA